MSGGIFDLFREGFAEIGSQFAGVFKSEDAGASQSGHTQGTSSSGSYAGSGGGASHGRSAWSEPVQFDPTADRINDTQEWGCKGKAGIYVIRDESDAHTLYVGKAEGTSKDILDRLQAHLTGEGNSMIRERIEEGETLTIRWVECDDPAKYESVVMAYLLPTDNERCEFLGSDRTRIDEEIAIGTLLDLPSFWHKNYADMVEEAKELELYVEGYGSNRVEVAEAIFWRCNEEIEPPDSDNEGGGEVSASNNNSENSDVSWFGNLFGGGSESESNDTSDDRSSDPESNDDNSESDYNYSEQSGSYDLFADYYDSRESNSYDSNNDSGGSGGSESGSSDDNSWW